MKFSELNTLQNRFSNKIAELEGVMKKMPQLEIPIEHHFSPGIYMRQMTMPAGSLVVGKIHKTEHMCILAKGSVIVANGDERHTYHAPAVVHSMPGTKRALHALEEVVWINVHHNPENIKDLDAVEKHFVSETEKEYLEFMQTKQIEGGK